MQPNIGQICRRFPKGPGITTAFSAIADAEGVAEALLNREAGQFLIVIVPFGAGVGVVVALATTVTVDGTAGEGAAVVTIDGSSGCDSVGECSGTVGVSSGLGTQFGASDSVLGTTGVLGAGGGEVGSGLVTS